MILKIFLRYLKCVEVFSSGKLRREELWPTLAVGGCVLCAPGDDVRLVPEALCRWYAAEEATVAFLTTQLAEALLAEPSFPHMRRGRSSKGSSIESYTYYI